MPFLENAVRHAVDFELRFCTLSKLLNLVQNSALFEK